MKIQTKRIVFAVIILISIVFGIERIVSNSFHNTIISVKTEAASAGPYQIFYDKGSAYSEGNSVNIFVHNPVETQVEFTIQNQKFLQFRIDPAYSDKAIVISEIRITHQQQQYVWKGKELEESFVAMHDIENWKITEGKLSFKTVGVDPYFGYSKNLKQRINFEHDGSKITWIILLILFFNFLTYLLLFQKNKLNQLPIIIFISDRLNNFHKPEKLFLVIALFWGVLTVFISPPFQSPDEPMHFFRIYHLSCGNLSTPSTNDVIGDSLPLSLQAVVHKFNHMPFHPQQKTTVSEIVESLNIPLNVDKKSFIPFPNTSHYLPIPYLSQAISMFIPRLLELPPLYLFYIGRLGNLLMWILMVYMAIRIIPFQKWVLVCIALLPMSLFQAASLSTDAPTNGLAFLTLAIIFRMVFTGVEQYPSRDYVLVLMLSLLLAMAKSAYFLIPMLILLIPKNRFPSISKQLQSIISVVIAIGLGVYAGNLFVNYLYRDVDLNQGMYHALVGFPENVKPFEQINFILSDIFRFVNILAQSYVGSGKELYHAMIGNLGWLDTPLNKAYVFVASLFIFVLAVFDNTSGIKISVWKKGLVFAIIVGTIAVIGTLLYLSWNPVGHFVINGPQGRYFLPVLPLIASLFYVQSVKISDGIKKLMVILFVLISFVVMNYTLISRYYIV